MSNETSNKKLVRNLLQSIQNKDPDTIIEEEQSKHPQVKRLLKNASKNQTGERGCPDFIVRHSKYKNLIVVIECKADSKYHRSSTLKEVKHYAVDGAIWYAQHLTDKFQVIAVGTSGEEELKVDTYLCLGSSSPILLDYSNSLQSLKEYYKKISVDPKVAADKEQKLKHFAVELHNRLRDRAKLSEAEKPALIGACLIALKNPGFKKSWDKSDSPEDLANNISNAVEKELGKVAQKNAEAIKKNLQATLNNKNLSYTKIPVEECILFETVDKLDRYAFPLLEEGVSFDILGHFYQEFLSYTGGDKKGLGIVLTPPHITELFCDLADVQKNSIVVDTCCGTGGFLVAAMNTMLRKASQNPEEIDRIKRSQLIGIEQAPQMYTLAVYNMILRGDGKTNIFNNSCFEVAQDIKSRKPNISLINPPYAQKNEPELSFIENQMDILIPGGIGVNIVPMSVMISGDKEIRERLFSKHSLLGVISMPPVFQDVGVNPVISIWRAHTPHTGKTWLCKLSDDGFIKTKSKGRCDFYGKWEAIKSNLLDAWKYRKEIPGFSCLQKLGVNDEWLFETFGKPGCEIQTGQLKRKATLDRLAWEKIDVPGCSSNDTIETQNWKDFDILSLFEIEEGKSISTSNELHTERDYEFNTPFITASKNNNGVGGFTNHSPEHKANCLTLIKQGDGGAGLAFYQPFEFAAASTIFVLVPKFHITSNIGSFLSYLLSQYKSFFSHGRGIDRKRLGQMTIKLPAIEDGSPDWKWIEEYMKECNEEEVEGIEDILRKLP